MNEQEQRIAIAESCGWKVEFKANPWDETDPEEKKWEVTQPNGWSSRRSDLSALPDYLNDLNVIVSAVKTFTREQQDSYVINLVNVCGHSTRWDNWSTKEDFDCINATASQRSKAFLLTIGKWKDA